MQKENGAGKSKNRVEENKNTQEKNRGPLSERARGRRPKPIDLHAALELTLIGSSIREKARQAGCSARTLMGRYAQQIELAEARMSGLLKMRLFHLAVVEGNTQALLFLVRRIYEQENGSEKNSEGKWSRRQLQQALRIVWRHSLPKPKLHYRPFRLQGPRHPRPGHRPPVPKRFNPGEA